MSDTYKDASRFLDAHEVDELAQFRYQLQQHADEPRRYELCVSKRDQLLAQQGYLEIKFAFYDSAFSQSRVYISRRQEPAWQAFTGAAGKGSESRQRIATKLKIVAGLWGHDLIEHYSFGGRGLSFMRELARTARQLTDWQSNALPRLQQLVRRRIQLIGRQGHAFEHPVEQIDLINARAWKSHEAYVKIKDPDEKHLTLERLTQEQLPSGYVFDKYGLLVPESWVKKEPEGSNGVGEMDDGPGLVHKHGTEATVDITKTASGDTDTNRLDCADPNDANMCVPAAPTDKNVTGTIGSPGASSTAQDNPSPQPGVTLRRSTRTAAQHNTAQSVPARDDTTRTRGRAKKADDRYADVSRNTLDLAHLRTLYNQFANSTPETPMGRHGGSCKRQKSPDGQPSREAKKHQSMPLTILAQEHSLDALPVLDREADEEYLAQAISEIRQKAEEEEVTTSRGVQTAKRLLPILKQCVHPKTEGTSETVEVFLLSGRDAKELVNSRTPDVPIITDRQQVFQWEGSERPIQQIFDQWLQGDDRLLSVQIPSRKVADCSYEKRSIRQVRGRFLAAEESDDPWNILDCTCPPPLTLPAFLTGRNCQLLARIREEVLDEGSAERAVMTRDKGVRWTERDKFSLIAQGGHNTDFHTDSHATSAWITPQEGRFGFVWMSRPTEQQFQEWTRDRESQGQGQQWRYWVLKPGQTIFFGSGLIHGVFRIREEQTLGFGGHILQWTGIDRWADVISKQVEAPDITNEDVTDAWKWVSVVEKLLEQEAEQEAERFNTAEGPPT